MDDVIAAAVANGCELKPAIDEDGELIEDDAEETAQAICAWLETVVSLDEEERAAIGCALGYAHKQLSAPVVDRIMKKIRP
jgi:hypothetical protein